MIFSKIVPYDDQSDRKKSYDMTDFDRGQCGGQSDILVFLSKTVIET